MLGMCWKPGIMHSAEIPCAITEIGGVTVEEDTGSNPRPGIFQAKAKTP